MPSFALASHESRLGRRSAHGPRPAARANTKKRPKRTRRLAESEPITAAIGLARIQGAAGKREEVKALLAEAVTKNPQSSALAAEAARWALDRDDMAPADQAAAKALELDGDQLLARWVQAERLRMTASSMRPTRLTNGSSIITTGTRYPIPKRLRGSGSARRNTHAGIVCPINSGSWSTIFIPTRSRPIPPGGGALRRGAALSGEVQSAEAARELKAALALNPNAAEIHAAIARLAMQNLDVGTARPSIERALELNPTIEEAFLVRGDILLANFQAAEAVAIFAEARALHPQSAAAAGRLAAAYAVVDGLPADLSGTRVGKIIERFTNANPHCGEFFASMAAALDQKPPLSPTPPGIFRKPLRGCRNWCNLMATWASS